MKIRFAVTPPAGVITEDHFPQYLEQCEALGFDTIWLSDIPLGPLGDPIILLTYAAAATRHLKLGANIVPLGRHPLWLAKQLAQLDCLSEGRLLISLVPGLGQAAERTALGVEGRNRGQLVDEMIHLMRRWWQGERVSGAWCGFNFDEVAVLPQPLQTPLEIWLGGIQPSALKRVGELADGWLTSAATPAEAGQGCVQIAEHARNCGRQVDAEHFGISIPVCRRRPSDEVLAPLVKRRKDGDLSQILAVGSDGLKALVNAHIDQGLSKFVLRPADTFAASDDFSGELEWLADTVLSLQT